jgi:conjugative transfer pilus assembly protein TraH
MPHLADADWLDDWSHSTSVSPPSSFKGTERSYYDFGGVSARWSSRNNYYPTSFQTPRLKSGCGGIDVMLGGMSFGDADQLVEKLEEILSNSPTVFLDLAVNVLCEECANSMKWIEDKLNALNNIQLDSCKASKALVASVLQNTTDNRSQELNAPISDFMLSSGMSDAYTEIQKDWTSSSTGKPDSSTIEEAVRTCPNEIKQILAATSGSTPTTLLENVANENGYSSEWIAAIRGVMGDVLIWGSEGMYESWIMPPCKENKDIFTSGDITAFYVQDSLGSCSQATSAQKNLYQWVQNMLINIATKMQSKQSLLSDEASFSYNYMTGQHRQLLALGLMNDPANRGASASAILAPLIVKSLTVRMVGDMVSLTHEMLNQVKDVVAKKGKPTNSDPAKCQTSLFSDTLADMEIYEKTIGEFYAVVKSKENDELAKVLAQAQLADTFHGQEMELRAKVMKVFVNNPGK